MLLLSHLPRLCILLATLLVYVASASPPQFELAGVCSLAVGLFSYWQTRHRIPRAWTLSLTILCLVSYFLFLQGTTVFHQDETTDGKTGARFQIGFGMADWTLQEDGLKWKRARQRDHLDWSARSYLEENAAFDDAKIPSLWNYREVATVLLTVLWIGFGASLGSAIRIPVTEQLTAPLRPEIPEGLRVPPPATNNLWYRCNPASDTVIVFVHGVMSDSRCWLYHDPNGQPTEFWPHLIEQDARFNDSSIFLAGYYTDIDAGIASIRNCADEVFVALRQRDGHDRSAVMDLPRIIFVCHSMGGIVARYLLETHADDFGNKDVGLVLIASPSYGSELANGLSWIVDLYRHKQSQQLKWGNDFLDDLDDRFHELVNDRRIPKLLGVEFYEHKFIVPGPLFFLRWKWLPLRIRWVVVPKGSAGRYFGAPKLLPNTDHFSIVKPKDASHVSHRYLLDFLTDRQLLTKTRQDAPGPNRYGIEPNRVPEDVSGEMLTRQPLPQINDTVDQNPQSGSRKELQVSKKRKVFISHSSKDKPFVRKVVEQLEKNNLQVWFDEQELDVGDSIVNGINKGLDDVDYLLVVLSRNSVESQWVKNELNFALMEQASKKAIVVLPAVIDDCVIPPLLRDRVYADFRTSFDEGLNRLIQSFNRETQTVGGGGAIPPTVKSLGQHEDCPSKLGALRLAELARRMMKRMNRQDVGIIWFYVFETKMDNDMANKTLGECVIELLDRANNRNQIGNVVENVCAERPDLASP